MKPQIINDMNEWNSRPLEKLGICESTPIIGKYTREVGGFVFSLSFPVKCQLLTGKYGERPRVGKSRLVWARFINRC